MIISHKYKFIFFKTRKTAGTSVEMALSKFCGAEDIIGTLSPEENMARIESGGRGQQNYWLPFRSYRYEDLKRLVRNKKRAKLSGHKKAGFVKYYTGEKIWNDYFKFCFERNPFDKAISRYYWNTRPPFPRPPLDEFLEKARIHLLSNWSIYALNDHVAVDFVGHYETMKEDLAEVARILGLPSSIELPRAKSTHRENREHYSKVLSPRARARIELVCAKELKRFGYSWEEPCND